MDLNLPDQLILTVAVPTFNRASLLEKCLDRVAEALEHRRDVEVIVLDNASTDDSERVARSWLEEISGSIEARYVKQEENLGIVGNIFEGLKLARGKYFTFLGDDDAFDLKALPGLLDILGRESFSLALEVDKAPDSVAHPVDLGQWSSALTDYSRFSLGSPLYKSGNAWAGIVNTDLAREHMSKPDFLETLASNCWGQVGLYYSVALTSDLPVMLINFRYGLQFQDRPFSFGGASAVRSGVDLLRIAGLLEKKFPEGPAFTRELCGQQPSPIDAHLRTLLFTWPEGRFRASNLWLEFRNQLSSAAVLHPSIKTKLALLQIPLLAKVLTLYSKVRMNRPLSRLETDNYSI